MPKTNNLIGQKFNKLTVISRAENKNGRVRWKCMCDCGTTCEAYGYSLKSGNTKSCGCLKKNVSSKLIKNLHGKFKDCKRFKDLTGKKFNRLTPISCSIHKSGRIEWTCRCDCGNIINVLASNLVRGSTKSCGCYKKSILGKALKADYETGTRLHRIWLKIKRRCRAIDDHAKYYCQRGIKVCDEWEADYKKFRDWAMSNGYDDSLTIDRIDNDKGYYPENCRWVTMIIQANNTRKNRFIEHKGEIKTIAQWARTLNVSYKKLYEKVTNNRYVQGFPDGYNLLTSPKMGHLRR